MAFYVIIVWVIIVFFERGERMYSSAYIWAKIYHYLEERLTPQIASTWFDDAEVVECTDSKLVLFSPSPFRKDMIERRASGYIKDAMKEIFDSDVELTVLGQEEMESFSNQQKKPDFIDFNPQFTFEKFVVGTSNRFAHAAALSVATKPRFANSADDDPKERSYNPLFIHGPSGLGKTHLLYAIATKVHKDFPEANIVYIKAEQFTNELIAAIQAGRNIEFREKYRNADLFLIDDIQFIAGKDSTQEEYFHTFNALFENKKQIVMTADRPPAEMSKLEERLRTRFECGLITEISPPDYETRVAILQMNAEAVGIDLPPDVCAFIAENVTSDVRKLEGAVNRFKAAWELDRMPITKESAMKLIKVLQTDARSTPTPQLILSEVCRFYSIEDTVLRSTGKSKSVSEARQIAMYLLQELAGYTTIDIGRELNRDHSTVIHGVRKVKNMLSDTSSGLQDNIRDIISNINSKM